MGLWERKEKKKTQRALVIWFCSENPVFFLVLILCPPSTVLPQQGSSDLTSCLTIIPSFIHSLNTRVCVCVCVCECKAQLCVPVCSRVG